MEDNRIKNKPLIGITIDIDGEYLRLKRLYPPAIIRTGGIPLMIPSGNDPSLIADAIDGLLIPGGKDIDPFYFSEAPHPTVRTVQRERTDFEIALLRTVMERKKPVFGICYGMQLINVALGGNLYQDIESQINNALDHRNGNHSIKIIQDSGCKIQDTRTTIQDSRFVVNSSHHQAVRKLGGGLEACAFSDDGIVEAFFLRDYPFLFAVQWHPERSDDELSLRLLRLFMEEARACR